MSAHGGGGDRWLVSYADFITLLMVLFVVLYSMGQTDLKKYKKLGESFKAAFNGVPRIVDPSISQSGGVDNTAKPAPIEIQGLPMLPAGGDVISEELSNMLASVGLGTGVTIRDAIEGSLDPVSEKLIFNSGTDQLVADAYPVLDKVAGAMQSMVNDIKIIAYTDNSTPNDPRYKDNWELSQARALKVAEYLISKGIDQSRLFPSGRAGNDPIYKNDNDPEHAALRNRAEIIVVYSQDANPIGEPIPGANSP